MMECRRYCADSSVRYYCVGKQISLVLQLSALHSLAPIQCAGDVAGIYAHGVELCISVFSQAGSERRSQASTQVR